MAEINLDSLETVVNEAFQESSLVDGAFELGGYGVDAKDILEVCRREYVGLILDSLKQIIELDAFNELQKKYSAKQIGFWQFARAYALKAFNEEGLPATSQTRDEFYRELFHSFKSAKSKKYAAQMAKLAEGI